MIIFTLTSSKGGTRQNQIVFCDDDAHIKSKAAYVLLREKFIVQDVDYIESTGALWRWLDYRETFLERRKSENNDNLACDYCGHEHLDIGGKNPYDLPKNNRNKNLATVDHIVAKSEGGEEFNEDNMSVACKKCNNRKKSLSLEDYLDRMTVEKLRNVADFLIEKTSNKKVLQNKLFALQSVNLTVLN